MVHTSSGTEKYTHHKEEYCVVRYDTMPGINLPRNPQLRLPQNNTDISYIHKETASNNKISDPEIIHYSVANIISLLNNHERSQSTNLPLKKIRMIRHTATCPRKMFSIWAFSHITVFSATKKNVVQ